MALNVFQIIAMHSNMFYPGSDTSRGGGSWASEFPQVADNINGQLSRYTRLAGAWASANITSTSTVSDSNGQNNGNVPNGASAEPWRSFGTYCVRGTYFTTPADGTTNLRSGYIGSFVGGYGGGAVSSGDKENQYGHDSNGSTVDFEPIYGHGAPTWPETANFNAMFRNSSSLPIDGAATVTKSATAQTWARTAYMPPVSYVIRNANSVARTISSGNVTFYVEERPSLQVAGAGSHSPFSCSGESPISSQTISNSGSVLQPATPSQVSTPVANTLYPYEYFDVTGQRKLNTRSMSLLWARIFDNGPTAYGWRYEEDGTDADGGVLQAVNAQTEYLWQRGSGQVQSPPISTAQEQRVRNAAYFTINEEYYGFVMDTKCMIFSNKSSMFPLLFFDLVDTWGATNPRIAGVAVTGTSGSNKVYFLSENGALALYDFTSTNGLLTLKTAASAPSANEGYSSLAVSSDGLTLYALYGTWIQDHRQTSAGVGTPRVAVIPYTIGTDTWGSLDVSPLIGRINGRHLREMLVLRDGRMAVTCEDVTVNGGDTLNTLIFLGSSNNCAWQVMFYDPSATSKWNTSIIRAQTSANADSAPLRSGTISNLLLSSNTLTVTVSNSFSSGNYVTINGITNTSWTWLNGLTVLVATASGSQFTATIATAIHAGVSTTAITAGIATRGMQYSSDVTSYWYRNVNAHMHDVKPNTLLVQGNWNCGQLWVLTLNAAGGAGPTTATLKNVSQGTPTNICHADIVPSTSANNAGSNPVDIRHAVDGNATIGDRTIFWFNDRFPSSVSVASSSTTMRMYYAPPSFVWNGTQVMSSLDRNPVDGSGYLTSWTKPLVDGGSSDYWTVGNLVINGTNNQTDTGAWTLITQFRDNYCHFVKVAAGGAGDSGPGNGLGIVYGKRVSQTLTYLPTYWKVVGGNWVLADSSTDAKASPQAVPASALTDVTMPYGLILNYGATGTDTYNPNEFYTLCLCYGNTKLFRTARYPWAMFAGQTFLQMDTRTMASQRAIAAYLVDTDLMTVTTPTVPLDPSSAGTTVTLGTSLATTNFGVGWATFAEWPKLNGSSLPYNGPLQMVLAVTGNPDPTTAVVPPNVALPTQGGTTSSWTVNGHTYVATSSSTSNAAGNSVENAFFGSPNAYWKANAAPTQSVTIDLGAANAQTVLSYSFRPYFDNASTTNNTPKSWTIQGSNTGAFAGEQTTVDTRSNVTPKRGMAFNCNGSTGSFRYYRMSITATGSGTSPALGMLQYYTATLATTISFSDIGFFNYGDNLGSDGTMLRVNQFARGLTFEVSTNGGSTYTPLTILWRAHNGFAFCFDRQTGVDHIRITCQSGFNLGTGSNGTTNDITNNAFGPVYLFDWMTGAGQTALNTARLGSSGASNGTAARGSWDDNILGIAGDAVTMSIDSGSPNALLPQLVHELGVRYPVYGTAVDTTAIESSTAMQIWDFNPVASLAYKVHPFWGFALFAGAGQNGAFATAASQPGTSLAITYHWGRRI
jgi:hypothetical protein